MHQSVSTNVHSGIQEIIYMFALVKLGDLHIYSL